MKGAFKSAGCISRVQGTFKSARVQAVFKSAGCISRMDDLLLASGEA